MDYKTDKRIVLTLDAGGTNFVFSAVQSNREIIEQVRLASRGDNLGESLKTIIRGFEKVISLIEGNPSAISFAFPGPADYEKGIIHDLENLPGYKGGIPLKQMLEEKFSLPVFVNNDGNLFAYGEAISGFLPYINRLLEEAGSPKRYKSLFGITLGTGFGAGFVCEGKLLIGDNSNAAEIWLLKNKFGENINVEEDASIRGVKRFYSVESGIKIENTPEPKDIYEIAIGNKEGDKEAAVKSFKKLGEVVGDALSNAITLFDAPVVIGGGLSGAYPIFLPEIVKEMRSEYELYSGKKVRRLEAEVYNLEEEKDKNSFLKGKHKKAKIPFSEKTVEYDPLKRIGIGISKLGTSRAVSIGAYAFALNNLDKEQA